MQEAAALSLIQAFPGRPQLAAFAARLLDWLNADLNPHGEPLTESRARALLLAAEALDEPTRHSFAQTTETEPGARIALHDLLRDTGLADNGDVIALARAAAGAPPPDRPATASWLALAVAAHAWRSGFPLDRPRSTGSTRPRRPTHIAQPGRSSSVLRSTPDSRCSAAPLSATNWAASWPTPPVARPVSTACVPTGRLRPCRLTTGRRFRCATLNTRPAFRSSRRRSSTPLRRRHRPRY